MAAPVYVYYQLDNFYQNHRRYVKSYDKYQLLGTVASKHAHKECVPLVYNGSTALHPCGLVANSLFNGRSTRTHAHTHRHLASFGLLLLVA